MRMKTRTLAALCVSILLVASCSSAPPLPTTTETLTWTFTSNHPNQVQLSFYSQDRNAAWPGGDMAYDLVDWEPHTFTLTCRTGEKICYGAWVKGASDYWGSGFGDEQACDNCCRTCVTGSAGHTILDP